MNINPPQNDIYAEYQEVFSANGEQLLIDLGFKALPQRNHILELKIAQHEARELGYHAIEYEGFINVFGGNSASGDEMVGGLILHRRWNAVSIYSFFIDPRFRGLGLGKRILELAEQLARQMGGTALVLETSTLHTYEFYLNNGFVLLSEVNGYIDGQTWFHMFKNLMETEEVTTEKTSANQEEINNAHSSNDLIQRHTAND